MPYSRKAMYRHIRLNQPSDFAKGTLRTITATQALDRGYIRQPLPLGSKVVVGKKLASKWVRGTPRWAAQTKLVPKHTRGGKAWLKMHGYT